MLKWIVSRRRIYPAAGLDEREAKENKKWTAKQLKIFRTLF
jgi:hypothetical protein